MNLVHYNVNYKAHPIEPLIKIDSMYTLHLRHFDKGYTFHGETHNFWEGLYVTNGKLCVTADERVFTLSSGGIVFHKPLELHKFSVESENGADLIIFTYDASGALENAMANKTLHLHSHQREIIENMRDYIIRTCEGADKNGNFDYSNYFEIPEVLPMLSIYISQLIISLSREKSRYTSENSESAVLFSEAVDYMNSRISQPTTVSDIARHINTSESSVKRIFAKYANMSVHRYLLLLKIQTATKLLRSGSTVGEVTDALGFSSQGYFSVCYKRETGKNPSKDKA